jgi:hypothetical protein
MNVLLRCRRLIGMGPANAKKSTSFLPGSGLAAGRSHRPSVLARCVGPRQEGETLMVITADESESERQTLPAPDDGDG